MKRALALACLLCAGPVAAEPEAIRCDPAQAEWRPSSLAETPDLSFLNHKPAGRHGFLRARGEGFAFADGTPARFWGANVVADAIFRTPDELITAEARRIAKLGFNLVRLHHHDSGSWVRPNSIAPQGPALLDENAMRKIDRWIAALKEQGVYVFLDLHTGRVFRPDQRIPGFAEMNRERGGPKAKGFLYFNEKLQSLTLEFADAFLGRRNPLTGLRYRDDPALAFVLVTNENDLSHHYGNLFAADKGTPWHRARFLEVARRFAERTGANAQAVTRTWEPGPAKLFLADAEREVAQKFRDALRRSGVRVPIAFTSYWGSSGTSALAALSRGDFIDVHSYAAGDTLRGDPRRALGFLGWIAAGHVAGMPLTVSEWNHGKPLQRDRYAAHLWMASVAALQDWDAPMLFAHSVQSFGRPRALLWNTALDPATVPLMPAAAMIYRRGDVAPARKRLVLELTREQAFGQSGAPARFTAISTSLEQSRVAIALPGARELPWLKPAAPSARDERVRDPLASRLAPGATTIAFDTGEVSRDFAAGLLRGDTPRSQFAVGTLSKGPVELSRVRIEASTDAAIAFTSLDDKPLAESKRILVAVAARGCSTTKREPLWRAQLVRGRAWLKLKGERRLTPLDTTHPPQPLERDAQGLVVPLDFGGSWALIEPPR